ncbi:CHAP domain-containing protein [Streptococcus sp. 959]|uniref:CHAP domain-containing protein n=1 Tax=Streptococcus sp. 959 TaxID=2582655 RepID=UPI0031F579E9
MGIVHLHYRLNIFFCGETGSTPKAGAIVSFVGGTHGTPADYGHVAFVGARRF